MPIPSKYIADFEEDKIYHIYNRTNNKDLLFLSDENKTYFLKKYKEILSPFIDTYCWCLLPNHFHLLIKVKPESIILNYLQSKPDETLTVTEKKYLKNFAHIQHADKIAVTLSELIEQTFKLFFQSYALSFNKQHNRKGNLFYKPFKRIEIKKESQFTMAIIYIHANAAKHKLVRDFSSYAWSSWNSIISNKPTLLLRNEVIEWFGGLEEFIKVHTQMAAHYYDCEIALED